MPFQFLGLDAVFQCSVYADCPFSKGCVSRRCVSGAQVQQGREMLREMLAADRLLREFAVRRAGEAQHQAGPYINV